MNGMNHNDFHMMLLAQHRGPDSPDAEASEDGNLQDFVREPEFFKMACDALGLLLGHSLFAEVVQPAQSQKAGFRKFQQGNSLSLLPAVEWRLPPEVVLYPSCAFYSQAE